MYHIAIQKPLGPVGIIRSRHTPAPPNPVRTLQPVSQPRQLRARPSVNLLQRSEKCALRQAVPHQSYPGLHAPHFLDVAASYTHPNPAPSLFAPPRASFQGLRPQGRHSPHTRDTRRSSLPPPNTEPHAASHSGRETPRLSHSPLARHAPSRPTATLSAPMAPNPDWGVPGRHRRKIKIFVRELSAGGLGGQVPRVVINTKPIPTS
ncbi:hypothetical protein DES53_10776 [Roseimicrobium gellanilyticum]|uniref:Uncharacterized protein n=1 Tax=Roseimicrobium gellanilyticum TaxID=748857 RepID=A0A366HHD9_9BACT|nr:hypothetical protein DES53_10776 [Roseimicrobium gellanilyticum]